MVTDTTYTYEYALKDHLGSVRVMFDAGTNDTANIIQETHYYPFGMTIDGLTYIHADTENSRLFSGKDYNSKINLNWYDFGARNYDPSLGMWFNVDPMAELEISNTPYNYVANNPVNYIDPNGMWKQHIDAWGGGFGDGDGDGGGGTGGSGGIFGGGCPGPDNTGTWWDKLKDAVGWNSTGSDNEAGRMSHSYNNSHGVGSYANGGTGESPESNGGVSAGGGGNSVAIPETPKENEKGVSKENIIDLGYRYYGGDYSGDFKDQSYFFIDQLNQYNLR